jgi:eukaryotic-like serine/threonine-protein kinase
VSDPFREELTSALAPHYTIDRELSGGGMSRVFVAVEHALNRTVVVKVLKPDLAADVNRDRFRREIMLVAQLHHPHIVPVLTAGERDDLLWYTMPFVEGESLRELIRSGRQASTREVVKVLHDVLDALDFAHTRGVIHRDIKPGNILRQRSHSLVTDFGVAKALSAALPHSGATSAGMAIGTPAYMAPEQLAADPRADHRVDLYAVGLLVYELLTGTQPFAAASPQETLAAQLTRMPKPLSEVRPDLPAGLSALITRLLAKNPDHRPATAAAALEELDELTTPSDARATRRSAGFVGVQALPRRRALLLTIGAAALAVGVGVWGWARTNRSHAPSNLPRASAKDTASATAASPTPTRPDSAAPVAAGATTAKPTAASTIPSTASKGGSPRDSSAPTVAKSAAVAIRDTAAPRPKPRPARSALGASLLARRFTPPRRVAVMPVRYNAARADLAPTSRALGDSLRKAFAAAGYDIASDADLVQLLSQPMGTAQRRAAEAAGIGAVVYTELSVRGSEVRTQATVLDVWRSATATANESADLDKPLESLGVVRDVTRALDRVSWRTRDEPRAVIVFDFDNHTGIDSLEAVARQIAADVKSGISREVQARAIGDSAALATRDVMERRQVAVALRAGALVSGSIQRARNDSITVRLAVRDLSEDVSFPTVEARIPLSTAPASAGPVIAQMIETMRRVNWGPKGDRNR